MMSLTPSRVENICEQFYNSKKRPKKKDNLSEDNNGNSGKKSRGSSNKDLNKNSKLAKIYMHPAELNIKRVNNASKASVDKFIKV